MTGKANYGKRMKWRKNQTTESAGNVVGDWVWICNWLAACLVQNISSLCQYWWRLGRIVKGKHETFKKTATITIEITHPCGACALTSCWYSKGECLTMFPKAPARESTKTVRNKNEVFQQKGLVRRHDKKEIHLQNNFTGTEFLPAALALVLATESVSKTTSRGTAGLSDVYSVSLW